MPLVPTGTVTFLFTNIEESTRLLPEMGDERFAQALADQRRLLRDAFQRWRGHELETQGDGFLIAFQKATDAVNG
ncbi:MAG: adenylate/guanylate cyclase domain-containing protein [bacterium]